MAEGFKRLGSGRGFFKFHRRFLAFAIDNLSDPEFKLWTSLRGAANDFEGSNLGEIKVTIFLIKKRLNWSQGKSSVQLKSLIKKGFIKRIKNGSYYISQNPQEVQIPEQSHVRESELNVRQTEQIVQNPERSSHKSQSYKDNKSSIYSTENDFSSEELDNIWDDICKKGVRSE